jgi:hypothetical protein
VEEIGFPTLLMVELMDFLIFGGISLGDSSSMRK